jgi:hypothetical protein
VNRRLRELVPGYRAARRACERASLKRLHRSIFSKHDVRAALLLNASASIRKWLLENVTLRRRQRVIDDALHFCTRMTCSVESDSGCRRNICILCAQFCEGCLDHSKDVSECSAACTICVSDYWDKCNACDHYFCDDCGENYPYDCGNCGLTVAYCHKCWTEGRVRMGLCEECGDSFCHKCVSERKIDMHWCEECENDYCDRCVKEGKIDMSLCDECFNEYCNKCVDENKVYTIFCEECGESYCAKCLKEGKIDMSYCEKCRLHSESRSRHAVL